MTDCVSPNHFEDTIMSAVILIADNSLIASTIAMFRKRPHLASPHANRGDVFD
jgi:hypothetical protein